MSTTLSISCFLTIFVISLALQYSSTAEEELECNRYLCNDEWEYVKAGQPYRFGPPLQTQGGDISLEETSSEDYVTCPRQAVVLGGGDIGGTFSFNPIVPDENGRVPLATALSISSADKLECDETGVLQMKRRSTELSFWHITADGTANTSASCFQFVNFPVPSDPVNQQSYVLQNCPYKCGRGTLGYCQDVGNRSAPVNYWQYLTSSRDPFEFAIRGKWDLDASI